MSGQIYKSIFTLCGVAVLIASCAPRKYDYDAVARPNVELYKGPSDVAPSLTTGGPQTVLTASANPVTPNQQIATNTIDPVAAPQAQQTQPTYGLLLTPSTQKPGMVNRTNGAETYAIQAGDTIYAVGRKYNIHPKDLMQHNNLSNPDSLKIGQVLHIPQTHRKYPGLSDQSTSNNLIQTPQNPVQTALYKQPNNNVVANDASANSTLLQSIKQNRGGASANKVTYFKVPPQGRIIQNYDPKNSPAVRVAVPNNTTIRASAPGRVIYVGNVEGYGNLVLIRHDSGYVSNYAKLDAITVKQGQTIAIGDKIATVGTKNGSSAEMMFELRKGTKTVNPTQFIG